MDIRSMQMLCKVYEMKSFTKASKELFMSQQALSKQVLNIEEEFKSEIFSRKSSGVEPTDFGELIYQESVKLLQAHQQMTNKLERYLLQNKKNVRIAMENGLFVDSVLMESLVKDCQTQFGINVEFISCDGDKCRKLVQDNEVEAALIMSVNAAPIPKVSTVFIGEIGMYVSFFRPAEESGKEKDFSSLPKEHLEKLVYLGGNSLYAGWMEAMAKAENLSVTPAFVVHPDPGMYILGYMRSFDLALVHWKSLLPRLIDPDLVTVPLDNFKMRLCLITAPGDSSEQKALEFAQVVKTYIREI